VIWNKVVTTIMLHILSHAREKDREGGRSKRDIANNEKREKKESRESNDLCERTNSYKLRGIKLKCD
jgi:hypothetical protein